MATRTPYGLLSARALQLRHDAITRFRKRRRMAEHQDCKHKFLHKQRVIGKQAAGKDPVYKEGVGTIGKGGGGTDET